MVQFLSPLHEYWLLARTLLLKKLLHASQLGTPKWFPVEKSSQTLQGGLFQGLVPCGTSPSDLPVMVTTPFSSDIVERKLRILPCGCGLTISASVSGNSDFAARNLRGAFETRKKPANITNLLRNALWTDVWTLFLETLSVGDYGVTFPHSKCGETHVAQHNSYTLRNYKALTIHVYVPICIKFSPELVNFQQIECIYNIMNIPYMHGSLASHRPYSRLHFFYYDVIIKKLRRE